MTCVNAVTLSVTDELLAAAVRFSEDAILITDTQLNLPGPRIVYVNPGFTKMTGYTPMGPAFSDDFRGCQISFLLKVLGW